MRYLQILCLAFALTTTSVSMVVYGKLTSVHKNTCLVISFPQHSYNQANDKLQTQSAKNKLERFHDFLNVTNIPLEISHVITSTQCSVPESFFNFFKEKFEPGSPLPYTAPPAPKPVTEPVKILSEAPSQDEINISAEIYQAELTKVSTNAELIPAFNQAESELVEKPVLRKPSQ